MKIAHTRTSKSGKVVVLITSQDVADLAAEILGKAPTYNTLYQGMKRAGVTQESDGYPAMWNKDQVIEYLSDLRDRKTQRASAPLRFAEASRLLLIETGVPQSIPEICVKAEISQGRAAARAIKGALDKGLVYDVVCRGTNYYVPTGAAIVRGPGDWRAISKAVGELPERLRRAYDLIVSNYIKRIVPLSAGELGELMDSQDPTWYFEELLARDVVVRKEIGRITAYVPSGHKAVVRKGLLSKAGQQMFDESEFGQKELKRAKVEGEYIEATRDY